MPFYCVQCGKPCVPGVDRPAHASKFCGKACKDTWHRARTAEHREATRSGRARRRRARAKLAQSLADNQPRLWIMGKCQGGCGKDLTACRAASWQVHYCSTTCSRRVQRARHRARKRLATVEMVSHSKVFERDGWVCQLCGDPVDPTLRYPNDQCASIDHIIPLSKGGDHSYANTQLAHALCNSLKGNRESGSMIFAA